MNAVMRQLLAGGALGALLVGAAQAQNPTRLTRARVDIDWQQVEDPGNPNDTNGNGKVGKIFRMSRFETTNEQYATFLSWKARVADPLGLYNTEMSDDPRGGIDRTGNGTPNKPYRYTAKVDMADKPVNFVSWFDAARFVNWMENGQRDGDTEDGAYTLLGGTPIPTNGDTVTRNASSVFYLPNDDQWYKAAYYDPSQGYFLFATRSNQLPTLATATPMGGVSNPGPNVVNYLLGADWGALNGHVTTIGACGATSYYGCYDLNGNVFEWNETIFVWQGNRYRISRGGDWEFDDTIMDKDSWGIVLPFVEKSGIGFRVAAKKPE